MQGLYQGTAGTMGSSQMRCSHKCSLELKSLLPRLIEIGGFVSPAAGLFSHSADHSPLCGEITDVIRSPGMYFLFMVLTFLLLSGAPISHASTLITHTHLGVSPSLLTC